MRLRLIAVGLIALLAGLHVGCGTVMGHSGLQEVHVHLNPDDKDAVVKINGIEQGKGSGVYKVDPKRDGNRVDVTTQDGKSGQGSVVRELMPGVVVADAFMLIFPIYIDYLDGGMWSMTSDIAINLGKVQDTTSSAPDFPSNRPSNATPVNTTPATETKACAFCGEQRPIGAANCPHCGQK